MNSALISTFQGSHLSVSKTVMTNYTFDSETETVNVDASSGPITVTLPLISSNENRSVVVRKIDSSINAVIVSCNGADLYQGVSSFTLDSQWSVKEVSNNGTEWLSVSGINGTDQPFVTPEMFGAVGDGVHDDTTALQATFALAISMRRPVLLSPKVYTTSLPFYLNTDTCFEIKGTGITGSPIDVQHRSATIKAIASMRAVFTITNVIGLRWEGLTIDGNDLVEHGLYFATCSNSHFDYISIIATIRDCIFLSGEGDSLVTTGGLTLTQSRQILGSRLTIDTTDFSSISGSVACSTANGILTFTGTPDLTTLGLIGTDTDANQPHGVWIVDLSGGQRYAAVVKNVASATTLNVVYQSSPSTYSTKNGEFTASGCAFLFKRLGLHTINDSNSFLSCAGGGNGRIIGTATMRAALTNSLSGITVASTVSTTLGSATLTFSGSPDLWSLGLREHDLIYFGTGAQRRLEMISDVPTPNSITLSRTVDFTATGLDWATGIGDYYKECFSSDNNQNVIHGMGSVRLSAGAAFHFNGQTGNRMEGVQVDYCGMTGIFVGGPNYVINTLILHPYVEACGPQDGTGWQFVLGGAQGLVIQSPISTGSTSSDIRVLSGWGLYMGRDGLEPLGTGYTSSLPSSVLANPTVTGKLTLQKSTIQLNSTPWTTTIPLTTNIVTLDPAISDVTVEMLSPNTIFSGSAGIYMLQVQTTAPASVTLVGGTFPGTGGAWSGLFLRGSDPTGTQGRVRLDPGDTFLMYSDGSYFWEIATFRLREGNVKDATSTPGAVTQNGYIGRVAIASGAASVVVTNARVTAASVVLATLQSADSTLTSIQCVVPAAGSFTIQGNANATAATNVAWKLEQ